MKTCFGVTPCTTYGDAAGENEPGLLPQGGRYPIHDGYWQPSKSAPQEKDPASPREGEYRMPRCVADFVAARPVNLAIIDGIESQTSGEGINRNTRHIELHVLAAGLNAERVDAVGVAVMGFDPMADRGTAPFEACDKTLRPAEELGVGTRDLKPIEVIGEKIGDVLFDYRKASGLTARRTPSPYDLPGVGRGGRSAGTPGRGTQGR